MTESSEMPSGVYCVHTQAKTTRFCEIGPVKMGGIPGERAPRSYAFEFSARRGRIEVQILICIEALAGKVLKEKHTIPLWCAKIPSGSHLTEMLALICLASLR